MAVTLGQICTAVHDALEELVVSGDLNLVENYNELREGKATTRSAQVYWEEGAFDSDSETDRTTFIDAVTGAPGVRQSDETIFVDLYVRQRSQLNEDWGDAIDLGSIVTDKLEEFAGKCPPFELGGLKSVRCTYRRVVFSYTNSTEYTGVRYELVFRIF